MKQKLLLAMLSVFCIPVLPGQTLTTMRNAYRAADFIVKQQVEYKDPGIEGTGLIWDFSSVQPINEEYTLKYFIPDSTRMDTLCGREHRTRYYYRLHNDSLWAIGFENSTTLMQYLKPELKMRFPLSYGDTLFSVFEGLGQYSHRMNLAVKGYTRVRADGRGELKLPESETVQNALRIHTLRYYTETGKDSVEMTFDTYAWYAEGIRYPVFESVKTTLIRTSVDVEESKRDTTVFRTSFYYPPEMQLSQISTDSIYQPNSALQGAEAVFTEARIMPNPVVNNLYLSYKLTRPARVWFSVHNSVGTPLLQTSPRNMAAGYDTATINMTNMISGNYLLYVHVDDMLVKQVIIKK